jgi:hypothetical protein
LALFALTPPAAAHHSEPYCYWGKGVLPETMLLRVSLERDHYMQSECDGTKLRVQLVYAGEYVVFMRDGQQAKPNHAESAPADQSKAKKAKKAKRCKGKYKRKRKAARCRR